MDQTQFDRLQESVARALRDANVNEKEAGSRTVEILGRIQDVHDPAAAQRDRELHPHVFDKNRFTAIPDGALELVPALVKSALALLAGRPEEALPELVGILYRSRTLGIEITVEEAAVLRVLKSAKTGGERSLPVVELLQRLNDEGIKPKESIATLLERLRLRNTEKTKLVTEESERWSIGNV